MGPHLRPVRRGADAEDRHRFAAPGGRRTTRTASARRGTPSPRLPVPRGPAAAGALGARRALHPRRLRRRPGAVLRRYRAAPRSEHRGSGPTSTASCTGRPMRACWPTRRPTSRSSRSIPSRDCRADARREFPLPRRAARCMLIFWLISEFGCAYPRPTARARARPRPRGAAVAHSRLGVLQALADGSAPAAGLRRLSAAARSGSSSSRRTSTTRRISPIRSPICAAVTETPRWSRTAAAPA